MTVALQPRTMTATKRALLVLSHALERAFDTAGSQDAPEAPGLVIGLFQRREYFDVEAERYALLAAAGHTVIVGFVGSTDGLPPGVQAVQFDPDDPRGLQWVLVLVRGAHASALVATDSRDLSAGELTLQSSRLFDARWTLRRQQACDEGRTQVAGLADLLAPGVARSAGSVLSRSAALPVSDAEAQLAAAADHLVSSVVVGQRRATRLRVELETTQSRAERDQLTGLHNRHYLERYLGGGDAPADLLTLLVDVDDLKTANDRYGHAAGDAVLSTVAETLRAHSRPGDVVVRWGGDEFLMLAPAPDSGPDAGLAFAERLAARSAPPGPPSPGSTCRCRCRSASAPPAAPACRWTASTPPSTTSSGPARATPRSPPTERAAAVRHDPVRWCRWRRSHGRRRAVTGCGPAPRRSCRGDCSSACSC